MTSKLIDLRPTLEQSLGIRLDEPILLQEMEDHYPLKKDVWDNWLPFAFRGFQELQQKVKREGMTIESFASIGTGSGADAIGASFIFDYLRKIVLTDITREGLKIAVKNVEKYAGKKEVTSLHGPFCKPLLEKGIMVDLIYENLPNIPSDSPQSYYSYYHHALISSVSSLVNDYFLTSHYTLLQEAKKVLNKDGSVVSSIGGRIPFDILRKMVEDVGYHCEELVCGFKLQTEADDILKGYAKAEQEGISFDFYRYDEALQLLREVEMEHLTLSLEGAALKELLLDSRISAREAYLLYQNNKDFKVGHTVHMIRAKL